MQKQAAMGYVPATSANQPRGAYPQQQTTYPAAYGQPVYGVNTQQINPPVVMAAPMRSFEIIVPNGAFGGSILQITDPQAGTTFQVTVPAGLQPGMKFEVQLQRQAGTAYQAPQQQPMVYQQRPKDNDDCGAFLMGMFCCCTLCCLAQ